MGALTAAERRDLDDARIVQEFERPKLKALTQGLNATFYEYNELVIQYGCSRHATRTRAPRCRSEHCLPEASPFRVRQQVHRHQPS